MMIPLARPVQLIDESSMDYVCFGVVVLSFAVLELETHDNCFSQGDQALPPSGGDRLR